MGCDIHATLDYEPYKLKATEQDRKDYHPLWRAFAQNIDIDRNYTLFNILAGVRDHDIRPIIALPRGVPDDASFEFAEELEKWDGDGHSTSWVTFPELRDYVPDPETVKDYQWDVTSFREDDWYRVMEMLANKYGEENVRLCFFFDN